MICMLWQVLLQRAHDDDYRVAQAVLTASNIIEASIPDRVIKLLESITTKCLKAIHTGLL